MKKIKTQCRRYGISLVAMLGLLGIGSAVHANAANVQQASQRTYSLISPERVQSNVQGQDVVNSQANQQAYLNRVHGYQTELQRRNIQNSSTTRNNTYSQRQTHPTQLNTQLEWSHFGYSKDKATNDNANTDYPDGAGFNQFLNQVNGYVSSHAQGKKSDIQQAEQQADKEATKAYRHYQRQQTARYVKRTHAKPAQAKIYRHRLNKHMMRKFTHMYNIARSQLGKPYAWGGNGPVAFDCSGFTKYLYYHAMHKVLPRTVGEQYNVTRPVSYKHARFGDLVFFNNFSHVGLYLGHDMMVDAQLRGVVIEHVHAPWWNIDGFGRVVR